ELDRGHLNGDDRNEPIEQADDVEEPGRYLLGDDHGDVLILRPPPALSVPVLDGADDVRLVSRAELQLNLVTSICQRVVQKQIEPTSVRLRSLHVLNVDIAQAQ